MGKILRVTSPGGTQPTHASDGSSVTNSAYLLGDHVLLGKGPTDEDVYGIRSGPTILTDAAFWSAKLMGTNRWILGPAFYLYDPGYSWQYSVAWGWDGGVSAGSDPPSGTWRYTHSNNGGEYSTARPDLHVELVDEGAHAPWFPWCCLNCPTSPSTPQIFCRNCLGPVCDFWVTLNFPYVPGDAYDERAFDTSKRVVQDSSANPNYSPIILNSCTKNNSYNVTTGGITYYVVLQLNVAYYSGGEYSVYVKMTGGKRSHEWFRSYPSPYEWTATSQQSIYNLHEAFDRATCTLNKFVYTP